MNAEPRRAHFLNLLQAASALSGAGVCVYDCTGLMQHLGLLQSADREIRHHGCAFCEHVRDLPGGRERCIVCDLDEGMRLAEQAEEPLTRRCHAGLTECLVPVRFEGRTAALVFLGQCRLDSERRPESESLSLLGMDSREAREAYLALPCCDPERMRQSALLLQAALQETLSRADPDEVRAFLLRNEYSLSAKALRLIGNLSGVATVKEAARRLYVSPAVLSRVFLKENGVSLKEYIDMSRLSLARRLLREGRQSVAAVAMNVGFQDAGAFQRFFRKKTGLTPGRYRKAHPDAAAQPALHPVSAPDWAQAAEESLARHYASPFRVAALARQLGLSPDHLNRVFRKRTGMTLTARLWQLRAQHAYVSLQNGTAPAQAAREAGFPSVRSMENNIRKYVTA